MMWRDYIGLAIIVVYSTVVAVVHYYISKRK